jgi:hypothetical protein
MGKAQGFAQLAVSPPTSVSAVAQVPQLCLPLLGPIRPLLSRDEDSSEWKHPYVQSIQLGKLAKLGKPAQRESFPHAAQAAHMVFTSF